jgi:protein O-GlcNAc transferase
MSVQQQLEHALALHQADKFAEAAAGYRKILRKQPAHIDALHCLGLAERALGELASARARLERVVAIRPGFAEARGNLGLVYSDLGELVLAEQAARAALELKHIFPFRTFFYE